MKKIFLILIFGLILVNGCDNQKEIKEPLCNLPYFEFKQGECCLDQNSNQICDKNEGKEETKIGNIEGDTEHSSVRALIVERCEIGGLSSAIECPWSYITESEIQLRLVSKKPSVYIQEIEIPNEDCKIIKVNQILRFNEDIKINIPCDFKKDSISSGIVIYHIKDLKENFDETKSEGYEISATRGIIEGIVRRDKSSKTEEAIQGIIKEECNFSSIFFSCYKPIIDNKSISFYLKNEGQRLNLTRVEIPNIPCSKNIEDVSFESGDKNEQLISLECDFNKNTVTSEIIFYVVIQPWNDNFKSFDEPKEYVLKGIISGIVR